MLTMTIDPLSTNSSADEPLSAHAQQFLASARQKLCSTNMPPLLRVVAFLGTSCQAMAEPDAYIKLMQELCQYKGWWKTCEATPAGILKSSNPDIDRLLEPINRLHLTQ
jgi:hypothetical protein